jgi:type IV pilus assembly protein PilN
MIRINLLGVERQKARRAPAFDIAQRLTLACSLILVVAGVLILWWWWSLKQESARVDAELASAQQEVTRLRSLIGEVSKFEARRAQLRERVQLIEQLRTGQSIPVQLLDQVSRSLPEMMWLTQMQQDNADVTIDGRSTTLMALSDFVANLGNSDFFKKPIEIVNSQVETTAGGTGGAELIRFTVKAQLAKAPGAGTPAGPPGAPRR